MVIDGITYKWDADQDSEHLDFTLYTDLGEIWVAVEIGYFDRYHNNEWHKEKRKHPLPLFRVEKIIVALVEGGYLVKYFENEDMGLWFDENDQIREDN